MDELLFLLHTVNRVAAWLLTGTWQWPTLAALFLMAVLYVRGWSRLRRLQPTIGSTPRLLAFAAGWLALTIALASPLFALRQETLVARSVQQVLLGIAAPPLLWLACVAHGLAWGLPRGLRHHFTRRVVRASAPLHRAVAWATHPVAAWIGTVGVFMFWHEPFFVNWMVTRPPAVYLGLLVLFWITYMLFWWHVVGTGPRLHRALPVWFAFAYLIAGGEIPNIAIGIALSFRENLAYPVFAPAAGLWGPQMDQMVSGAIIWVVGSFTYVFSAVGLMGRFFRNDDRPVPTWDHRASHRTILPGLEHRVDGSILSPPLPAFLPRPHQAPAPSAGED